MGNRVYKWSYNAGSPIERNYIVDASGRLATILCEIDPNNISDPNDPNSAGALLKTSYIYAGSQPICCYDVNGTDDYNNVNYEAIYFYLTDRLGNVRVVIDADSTAQNSYTYTPFGQYLENNYVENVYNPLKFTGQWYDEEIGQYYLRARQYDPELMRFISRDPVRGKNENPLTLHPYLYCMNNSINAADPSGRFSAGELSTSMGIGGIFGGIFKAINNVTNASMAGMTGKGIAAAGGVGFLEGFGLGALGGGMASLSAQGFLWMGFKESISLYATSGAVGGGISGATEGLLRDFFSNDKNLYAWSDYAIGGIIGGALGGACNYGGDWEGSFGDFGFGQLGVALYQYFDWFRDLKNSNKNQEP